MAIDIWSPLLSGLGGLVNAVISPFTESANRSSQEQINRQNIQMQREINAENLEFQRSVNEQNQQNQMTTWQREDNAVQRRAADLAAAGLHPTLAAGSAAAASAPIRAEASRAEAPRAEAYRTDLSGMAQGIGVLANVGKVYAETKQTEAQTHLIRQQVEASKDDMRHKLEMEANWRHQQSIADKRSTLIDQQLQHGSSVLRNMEHDYDYARRHNLPVGRVEESQIRRIEFVLQKLQDIDTSLRIPPSPTSPNWARPMQELPEREFIEAMRGLFPFSALELLRPRINPPMEGRGRGGTY